MWPTNSRASNVDWGLFKESNNMEISELRERFPDHWKKACAIRVLAMDAVQNANSGHPGMPMGLADVATVLFEKHLKFDPSTPDWADRDRFVLSAGHGSMLLYALLHLTGYKSMTMGQIRNFRQLNSIAAGHPEIEHSAGIETTTGPLGQGFANAVGMAIAEESLRARFGKRVIDHFTYVVVGDGCLMEGISHEAIGLAGKLQLSRLIAIWDNNGISIDGKVEIADSTDQLQRFEASDWSVFACDGHNPDEINNALNSAKESSKPSLIACTTQIGLGAPNKQGTAAAHGSPLGDAEIAEARKIYGWPHSPFEIPSEIRKDWEAIGAKGLKPRLEWEDRFRKLSKSRQDRFNNSILRNPPQALNRAISKIKRSLSEECPSVATRKASEMALTVIDPVLPDLIGGSADLTGSNNTKVKNMEVFGPDSRSGKYIHYGIREHGMAGTMNGIALHGGVRPYGGTFLCFSDYARASMRLSAYMELPVIYVMTHDSIGLGEDGPTHQPVEHLSALRAIPNLNVIRPCDAVETAEAWENAILECGTPSVLVLSRQSLPTLRKTHSRRNLLSRGAYTISESRAPRKAILIATGSEVAIAKKAADMLEANGVGTRVVSMPCWELFAAQKLSYRRRILPRGSIRVAVEAAVRHGWDRWLCGEGGSEKKAGFVGMSGFGASAPGNKLFEHFEITPEAVVERVTSLL